MSELEYIRCRDHQDRPGTMVCITCKGEFICPMCVATTHMTHLCADAEGFTEVRKATLKHLLQKANSKISSLDFKKNRVDKIQSENLKNMETAIAAAKARNSEIKSILDGITDGFIETCKTIKDNNKERLDKIDKILTRDIANLGQEVLKCKRALGNESYGEFASIERQLRSLVAKPNEKPPVLTTPIVQPPKIEDSALVADMKKCFGNLERRVWKLEQSGLTEHDQSVAPAPSAPKPDEPFTITVRNGFELPGQKYIRSICPLDEEKAWVVCGGSHEAHLMDTRGETIQSIAVNSQGVWITDISRGSDGDKCVFCCGDGTVWNVQPDGKMICKFCTNSYTNSLNMTERDDCLAVCRHREQNIIKCSLRGKVEETIDKDEFGRQLFQKPVCIRVNHNTGDMIILEANTPRHLIILRSDLKVLGRYYGNQNPDDDTLDDESFQPWDVCFDSRGNILVADGKSKSVLLLDKDGKEIRTLLEDEVGPTCLGVGKNGDIWVGFDYGSVKIIKFSI